MLPSKNEIENELNSKSLLKILPETRQKSPPEAPTKYVSGVTTNDVIEPTTTPTQYKSPTRNEPCTNSNGMPIIS